MLYDPRWEQQTKADPFTLESLIAWLEKQPTTATYCYSDLGGCLLATYFRGMGFPKAVVGGTFVQLGGWHKGGPTDWPLPFSNIASMEPRTYGAALERARAALNK